MRIGAFDVETSGTDVFRDKIIQSFFGIWDTETEEWVEDHLTYYNWGIDIPEGAEAVHGISKQFLEEHGKPPSELRRLVYLIVDTFAQHWDGTPPKAVALASYNGVFDNTMLNANLRTKQVGPDDIDGNEIYWAQVPWEELPLIDPLIIDKHVDKYRKGSRKLVDVAPVYGVPRLENAHDAKADCEMTARLAAEMLKRFYKSASEGATIENVIQALQPLQAAWKREQAESLQAYFRRKTPDAVVNPEWPEQHSC